MKIYLTDQSKKFPEHLEFFKGQPVIQYDRERLVEKNTIIAVDATRELRELRSKFLFDYKVFPSSIMTYMSQWKFENRKIEVGDTIVQQAFIPSIKRFSLKIIFGVRIKEIINEPERIGFSYETLEGHVEKGISIFTLENTPAQKTIFKVHTFSAPGNRLTQVAGPIFAVPYQTYCTSRTLVNVKRQLESH